MKYLSVILFIVLCFSFASFGDETDLNVSTLSETPSSVVFEDVDNVNGNRALNLQGDVFFIVKLPTGSAGSAIFSVLAQDSNLNLPGYGKLKKESVSVSLTVGSEKTVGPFSANGWNDSIGNLIVSTTGTGAADVDVAAFRAPKP